MNGVIDQAQPAPPTEFGDMLSMFRACVSEVPQTTAIYYFDKTISYRELDAQSDAVAAHLLKAGVSEGDRVAILLQNVPQFVMMTVAAWKIGAIPLPINPMYRVSELARIFADSEPALAISFSEQAEDVAAAAAQAGIETKVWSTDPRAFQTRDDPRVIKNSSAAPADTPVLENLLETPAGVEVPPITPDSDSLGLLLYTSGTTGVPKGAMIRHSNLTHNSQSLRDWCGLSNKSRILGIAPFFHITGFACQITTAMSARAGLIVHFRVEPTLLLDMIREHQPTFVIGAITAFNALSSVPGITPADMASFDKLYSGGAPIPPALLDQIEERLGVKIHSCYGMTELTAPSHLAPAGADIPVDPTSGALSIGKLSLGTSAKIIDPKGKILPRGELGELAIRGAQVMKGYWRKPTETAEALKDGWMHTGDVAFVDEDGWYYLVDRIKDVIIASGFKVWPREVEDVLYAHPTVREAAVIGVPDSYRGETVKAYVSLKSGVEVSERELIAHCRDRLAAYKVPSSVEILEDLPKTVTGKIQRAALRAG